jgi:predicted ATPase/DNA-binding SARP family transcriptional activator
MESPWRIELFGSLQMRQGSQIIARFQTYKTGALLAFLAFYRNTAHSRESLAELLWPDADPESARNSLRVALASLRRQLEPTSVPVGAVLIADRVNVRLNPDAFTTDVLEFETLLARERQAEDPADAERQLMRAVECYRGPLLANHYEDWITSERERLSDAYLGALRRLTKRLVEIRELDRALEYANKAVAADPLREGAHRDLMRLYAAIGRPAAALQQYQELERLLHEELGASPSAATTELVRQLSAGMSKMPAARTVAPHAEPEPVELPVSPAPAAPISPAPSAEIGSVPIQFTRFFGREQEISELVSMLGQSTFTTRLATVTGPGGAGKTRLAVEAGARLKEAYAHRVWFVDLADTQDASLIPDAVAASIRIPVTPETSVLDQVAEYLGRQPSLLILDNFEQVADEGAPYVEALLDHTPGLVCLVTSQRRLELVGEQELVLEPLPVPSSESSVAQLADSPSVRLFVDRAQAARPDFALTERNAPAIVALCARLEGVPLALELAAAWAQMLTPAQMLERLSARFELLVSPRRRGLARHRTLRAAIDWSYDLLAPELQHMFARLSVFRGSWDMAAAAAVCDDQAIMESLWQLRQRSLIAVTEQDGAMRFRMLEALREYAEERLEDEARAAAQAAHSHHYIQLVRELAGEVTGANAREALDRLEEERPNIRAALEWCIAAGALSDAATLASLLWRFWYARGHVAEGRRRLDRIVGLCGDALSPEMWLLMYGAGYLAAAQGDYNRACAAYEIALDLAGDASRDTSLLANHAAAARNRGDFTTARELRAELLARGRDHYSRQELAYALDTSAGLAYQQGDLDEAEQFYRESLALRRQIGDRWGEADALSSLATVAAARKDEQAERAASAAAQDLFLSLSDSWGIASSFLNLGQISAEQGDLPAARGLVYDGLTQFREVGDAHAIAMAARQLAQIAFAQNDFPFALEHIAEATSIYRRLGDSDGLRDALRLEIEVTERSGDRLTARMLRSEMEKLSRADIS